MTALCKNLPAPLRMYLMVSAALTAIMAVLGLYDSYVLHVDPYNWSPLIGYRFTDLTFYEAKFPYFHTMEYFNPASGTIAYPAPAVLLLHSFFWISGGHPARLFLVCAALILAVATVLLGRALRRGRLGLPQTLLFLGGTVVLSYPLWLEIWRANIEIVMWAMICGGIAAYWRKRWYLCGVLIGLAAAMKGFPFIMLGLLFAARKYRAFALGLSVMITFMAVAPGIIGPTAAIASQELANNIKFFSETCLCMRCRPAWDHSLFSVIKFMTFKRQQVSYNFYSPWLQVYLAAVALICMVWYFLRVRLLPRTNQVALLTLVTVLIPPVSFDYTLMYVYVALAVLAVYAVRNRAARHTRTLTYAFALLALTTAPLSWVLITHVKLNGQIKSAALLGLLVLLSVHALPERDELQTSSTVA